MHNTIQDLMSPPANRLQETFRRNMSTPPRTAADRSSNSVNVRTQSLATTRAIPADSMRDDAASQVGAGETSSDSVNTSWGSPCWWTDSV